jgi:hypothetical protein
VSLGINWKFFKSREFPFFLSKATGLIFRTLSGTNEHLKNICWLTFLKLSNHLWIPKGMWTACIAISRVQYKHLSTCITRWRMNMHWTRVCQPQYSWHTDGTFFVVRGYPADCTMFRQMSLGE